MRARGHLVGLHARLPLGLERLRLLLLLDAQGGVVTLRLLALQSELLHTLGASLFLLSLKTAAHLRHQLQQLLLAPHHLLLLPLRKLLGRHKTRRVAQLLLHGACTVERDDVLAWIVLEHDDGLANEAVGESDGGTQTHREVRQSHERGERARATPEGQGGDCGLVTSWHSC